MAADGHADLARRFHHAANTIEALTADLADWKGRAERQYDMAVELIATLAAVEQERDALRKLREEVWQNPERWRDRCGVVGYPESGRTVCELAVGHEGYHRQGRVSWLGYYRSPDR